MHKFPFFPQQSKADCGPTCLRIIAKYYGRDIPLQTLLDASDFTGKDVSMHDLNKAAISIGFQTHAIKATLEELEQKASLPLIAWWRQTHFVVVYKITKKKVYIADPGPGLTTYTRKEFVERWTAITESDSHYGFALLLAPHTHS